MNTVFLEPLDVLYLRGNQHFGTAGAHGAALMPPWPSLAAGALRSRLMAEGATLDSLAGFRLTHFGLGQLTDNRAEALLPLPADVMVTADALDDARYAVPTALPAGIASSHALPQMPAFCLDAPDKPVGGLWMNAAGIRDWMAGQPITAAHLVKASHLWKSDERLGIALDADKRSAADGKIYTAEAVAMARDEKSCIGFVAAYAGAPALPANALVRLGGDGRGAVLRAPTFAFPQPDWSQIEQEGRFRLLLLTPGLFPDGWRPDGVPATLVAASVGRADTVSGWDLQTKKPKPAQRVAPAGSVYWFDKLADMEKLRTLADNGLPINDDSRRSEGFNHCLIVPWAKEK